MILLHHFGSAGEAFFLNPELITTVESKPDTIVHLITGQEMYVKESPAELVEKVREWRCSLLNPDSLLKSYDLSAEEQ